MPDLSLEQAWQKEAGYQHIAGIDEAGRGPLAGPVTTAAVILPKGYTHPTIEDSKKLSPKKREALYQEITSDSSIAWAIDSAPPSEIDEHNILQATHRSMRRAFQKLSPKADAALIDGLPLKEFPAPHQGIVKGDSLSLSIAAASILAKVERDAMMLDYELEYPHYGFARHKGYPTQAHILALQNHGVSPIHRLSFRPVAEAAQQALQSVW